MELLEPAPGPNNVRRVAEGGADFCLTSVNHYSTARDELTPETFIAWLDRRQSDQPVDPA